VDKVQEFHFFAALQGLGSLQSFKGITAAAVPLRPQDSTVSVIVLVTDKSVTGAPYSINSLSVSQLNTIVKSTMTETVPS